MESVLIYPYLEKASSFCVGANLGDTETLLYDRAFQHLLKNRPFGFVSLEYSPQDIPNECNFDWWERIICPIWICLFPKLCLTIDAHYGINIFLPVFDLQYWSILWKGMTWKNDWDWEKGCLDTSFHRGFLTMSNKNEWFHHWAIHQVVMYAWIDGRLYQYLLRISMFAMTSSPSYSSSFSSFSLFSISTLSCKWIGLQIVCLHQKVVATKMKLSFFLSLLSFCLPFPFLLAKFALTTPCILDQLF